MTDVAFLICVERGRLETEAILLAESLRQWGGTAADAPIYAFAPRADREPEPATVERLEALGATMLTEQLVERFEDWPTFNKIAASAWAERELDHETLVFTDTDSIFLGEPTELLSGDWKAAVRPVDRRIAGSRGKGKNEPFWRKMYAELGVRSEPFTETTVGQMRIRGYWNTGLVAARRSAGLFVAWEEALIRLFDAGIVQKKWPQFMDQLSWAGVTADLGDDLRMLSDAYNYPLRHRQALRAAARDLDLGEIVHMHYRLWLHMPGALEKAYPPFDPDGDRFRWLEPLLPLEPTVEETHTQ